MELNIYKIDGKTVARTVKASRFDLTFGTVDRLMSLLKLEKSNTNSELLKTIFSAWSELKEVLSEVFPDVSDDEWQRVKIKELMPLVIEIAEFALYEAMGIPSESKN